MAKISIHRSEALKHNSQMTQDNQPYPPPIRQPKRRLALQPWATAKKEAVVRKPLVSYRELPVEIQGMAQLHELEVHLEYKQDKLRRRESQLDKWAKQLADQQRELNEQEALLKARGKIEAPAAQPAPAQVPPASATAPATAPQPTQPSPKEEEELLTLRAELERQQALIEATKQTLIEREAYIEQCENDLVEKSMLLTEREARIEQNEEDHIKMSRSPFKTEKEAEVEQNA